MTRNRFIAAFLAFAFILSQSGLGMCYAYKAQNLRPVNMPESANGSAIGNLISDIAVSEKDVKAGATGATEEEVTGEVRDIVIAMFNKFDTGFYATLANCHVKRNTTGRIHTPTQGTYYGTYIVYVNGEKKYVVQNLSSIFDRDSVEHNIMSFLARQQKARELGLFDKGQPLNGWETAEYYPVSGSSGKRIHLIEPANGRQDVWRVMNNIEGVMFQQFDDIGKNLPEQTVKQYQSKAAKLLGQAMVKFELVGGCMPDDQQLQQLQRPLEDYHSRVRYLREFITVLKGGSHQISPGHNTPLVKMIEGVRQGEFGQRVDRMLEIFFIITGISGLDGYDGLSVEQTINKLKAEDTGALIEKLKGKSLFFSLDDLARLWQHRDPKLNNWIFEVNSNTGEPSKVISVIDLDTVDDEDLWTTDKGDLGRSISLLTGEGDKMWEDGDAIDKVVVDITLGNDLIDGYMAAIEDIRKNHPELKTIVPHYFDMDLSTIKQSLYRDIAIFYFELGFRFFVDFITELQTPDPKNGGITGVKRHNPYFGLSELEERTYPHYETIIAAHGEERVAYRPGFSKNLCLAEVEFLAGINYLIQRAHQIDISEVGITPSRLPCPVGWADSPPVAANLTHLRSAVTTIVELSAKQDLTEQELYTLASRQLAAEGFLKAMFLSSSFKNIKPGQKNTAGVIISLGNLSEQAGMGLIAGMIKGLPVILLAQTDKQSEELRRLVSPKQIISIEQRENKMNEVIAEAADRLAAINKGIRRADFYYLRTDENQEPGNFGFVDGGPINNVIITRRPVTPAQIAAGKAEIVFRILSSMGVIGLPEAPKQPDRDVCDAAVALLGSV